MRKSRPVIGARKGPLWIITFSDLMTLLLTFFVLLMSMSVVDERSKRHAMGSVTNRFGVGTQVSNPTAIDRNATTVIEPGRMEGTNVEDMEPLKEMLFEDAEKDLQFQENRYVQIFSINDEVLFKPGGTELSEKGKLLLGKLLPYLQRIGYPLLVAGHTATRRDEEGLNYAVNLDPKALDSTWLTSFQRAMSVYRFMADHGIAPGRLSLEAFGQYHPRFSQNTPEGRQKNRRVDLVLDKRNRDWIERVEKIREVNPNIPQEHFFQGFRFDLNMPGETEPPRNVPPEVNP